MQPSSRRVGAMRARSSASRKDSWPGLARRITTRVTAFLGSLALAFARALLFGADFFALRFAMMAGLYYTRSEGKGQDGSGFSLDGLVPASLNVANVNFEARPRTATETIQPAA